MDIKLNVEGFVYNQEENKNKQKVFLIHGFGIDHRCFYYFIKQNPQYEIHAVNIPGMHSNEDTKIKKRNLKMKCIANAIAEYIKEKNLTDLILIGHSLGGALAIIINSLLPEKTIKKLILLAPYNITSLPKIVDKPFYMHFKSKASFERLQDITFHNYQKVKENINSDIYFSEVTKFVKKNKQNLITIAVEMIRPTFFKLIDNSLKTVNIPMYLWLGEYDTFVENKFTLRHFSKFVKNFKYDVFKNCGHAFFAENFKDFNDKVAGAIKEDE